MYVLRFQRKTYALTYLHEYFVQSLDEIEENV